MNFEGNAGVCTNCHDKEDNLAEDNSHQSREIQPRSNCDLTSNTTDKKENKGKLHIAFLINSMAGGGAELSVLTLIESLLNRNHRVDLLLLDFQGTRLSLIPKDVNLFVLDKQSEEKKSLTTCSVPLSEIKFLGDAKPVAKDIGIAILKNLKFIGDRELRKSVFRSKSIFHCVVSMSEYFILEQPDLITTHWGKSLLTSILGRRCAAVRVPIVWSIRNYRREQYSRKGIKIFEQRINEVDRVHTVSNNLQEAIEQGLDLYNLTSRTRITTIHNPFCCERILSLSKQPVNHEWLHNDAKNEGAKVILAAGRISRQKNFESLIRAFSTVLKVTDARLIILGTGRERKRRDLEKLATELNVGHAVSLPGWIDNPYSFMASADLFVLSSNHEGFPRSLTEALICGCPVVSTDCPSGPREILENGKWGRLVPVGDEQKLADAIVATLSEKTDRLAQSKRGQMFDVDNLVVEYEKMFTEVVEN